MTDIFNLKYLNRTQSYVWKISIYACKEHTNGHSKKNTVVEWQTISHDLIVLRERRTKERKRETQKQS